VKIKNNPNTLLGFSIFCRIHLVLVMLWIEKLMLGKERRGKNYKFIFAKKK
jgi:hypothetical protein